MVTRLAKVVWWLGALFLLAAVGVQIAMQPPRPKVDPAGAYCSQVFSSDEARRAAKAPVGAASKSVLQQFDADSQQVALDECRAAAVPRPVAIENRLLALVVLGIPGLALWALAFVLAGSFWRPPLTRMSAFRAVVR